MFYIVVAKNIFWLFVLYQSLKISLVSKYLDSYNQGAVNKID